MLLCKGMKKDHFFDKCFNVVLIPRVAQLHTASVECISFSVRDSYIFCTVFIGQWKHKETSSGRAAHGKCAVQ